MSHAVEVIESYGESAPPAAVRRTVERLLCSLPAPYLVGLRAVALTGRAALNRRRRRSTTLSRGLKVAVVDGAGCYHAAWQGEAPWIELFPENILQPVPRSLTKVQFVLDLVVGSTLFHELGHHLHATQSPEHREREDVADAWRRRLMRLHLDRHYGYLKPLRWLGVSRFLRRVAKRRSPSNVASVVPAGRAEL